MAGKALEYVSFEIMAALNTCHFQKNNKYASKNILFYLRVVEFLDSIQNAIFRTLQQLPSSGEMVGRAGSLSQPLQRKQKPANKTSYSGRTREHGRSPGTEHCGVSYTNVGTF
jgi:hypothetical protein